MKRTYSAPQVLYFDETTGLPNIVKKHIEIIKQKKAVYDLYDKEVTKRMKSRWYDLQQENEEAYHRPCIDVKSILMALGVITAAFGLGVIVGGRLY